MTDERSPSPPPGASCETGGADAPLDDVGLATHTLRAALRHFEERLQAEEAQRAKLQRQIRKQAAAPLWVTARRRALLFAARALRRLLPGAWRGALITPITHLIEPDDYRVRMRALRASGQLARVRSVVLIAPQRLHRAARAVAELVEGMSLRCTVRTTVPTTFADDLYVVLSPAEFAQLPPPDRRILWLVESATAAPTGAMLEQLSASLAVFEAVLPRIAELQARGLVMHQIFYVPLVPFAIPGPVWPDRSPLALPHMLARAFHGCGVLDDVAFEAATAQTSLDASAIVLCIPESQERFAHARTSIRPGALLFPGLRQIEGWKGTALSYRYLARRARAAERRRLIIWEDDAQLAPDFDSRLAALLAWFDAAQNPCDLFSGLITDLSPQAQVKAVQPHGSGLLIEIDKVVGMVFGIYGPKALETLAGYRLEGEDVTKATIDRYLETNALSCCTLFPPLVGHTDHLSSTLWDLPGQRFLNNHWFNPMIDRSQSRLLAKIANFIHHASGATPRAE